MGQRKSFVEKLKYRIFLLKQFTAGIYFDLFQKSYKVEGLEFKIPFNMTNTLFRGRFVLNVYEKEERAYLKKYLHHDATVLELGACLGVVSCLTNKLLDNPEKHVVVEANPRLIEWIETNKKVNNCKFKVEFCMVTSQKKNEFYIHDLIVGGSSVRKTKEMVTVEGKTIGELEQQHGLRFDTLVMDIEGGEKGFISENKSILKQFRSIFMEVHNFSGMLSDADVNEIESTLKEEGFEMLVRDLYFQVWERKR